MSFGLWLTKVDNENFKLFKNLLEKGFALKGITFNMYDSNTREATIALFRVLQDVNPNDIKLVKEWAKQNINEDIFNYALLLSALYSNKVELSDILPPFINKPNFFVNSETIFKALKLKLNHGNLSPQEAETLQIRKLDDSTYTINTNYSGWNHPINKCDQDTNYFREDISLNSYYFGLHLLHPFWMSNEELDAINPRHAEHYLFSLKQLLSRYKLEKLHVPKEDNPDSEECDIDYRPYLIYENGLSFPNRPSFVSSKDISRENFVSIDIALRECLSRRIIMMSSGSVKINEENYLQLLPKLLRGSLDGVSSGETIRNIFGYGVGTPNVVTSAPSILHQHETALRDRVYWVLIERALNYSLDFLRDMGPYDLSEYETDSLRIIDSEIDDFVSFFDYYQLNINNALGSNDNTYTQNSQTITARQRRLKHLPFKFSFNVESDMEQDVIVRLFLGPQCYNASCWESYHNFFEIDAFKYSLKQGFSNISWSLENSSRFSFDDIFNLEMTHKGVNKYNMFKFPANLLIPKGLEDGLQLTIFVMITPVTTAGSKSAKDILYRTISTSLEVDEKPLGFPFHRFAKNYKESASNYRFYNVSVYHHKRTVNRYGYFTEHLY
ncbi:basic juvenile hormone-suppressible protein 2-like isoform X2 [Plodia interpunctella]|uniref:basic juvenile hormone-suppressible protein 2-like isoform X2 n=1 Tax=Plodia interpunctella TaxID=58824 RepID=UPI002367C1F4|nr:basic juvenile hormone-suppressible protein 2-like isoform X2 [Plodia interpunctella]